MSKSVVCINFFPSTHIQKAVDLVLNRFTAGETSSPASCLCVLMKNTGHQRNTSAGMEKQGQVDGVCQGSALLWVWI